MNTEPETPKAPACILKARNMTQQRQWRRMKRRELKAIVDAVHKYSLGCAFCPGYSTDLSMIRKCLKAMVASHSPEEWGP